MDLELIARTSAVLLSRRAARRAPSTGRAFDPSSRLAHRHRPRLARAGTASDRADDHGSNCSKGSRGSKGCVPSRFQVVPTVPAVATESQPWNSELLELAGTQPLEQLERLEPLEPLRLVLVLFCWLLSGLSVWRGSRPGPRNLVERRADDREPDRPRQDRSPCANR